VPVFFNKSLARGQLKRTFHSYDRVNKYNR
jgi:hypothetical protein